MYDIDDNIAIPQRPGRPLGKFGETASALCVGQSFFVGGLRSVAAHSKLRCVQSDGVKFSVRAVTEEGVEGARIWRIA